MFASKKVLDVETGNSMQNCIVSGQSKPVCHLQCNMQCHQSCQTTQVPVLHPTSQQNPSRRCYEGG
uniref:Six-cysteine peptide SCIFF n=1 Tax=Loa loa TaxID=7209 RepID=A0A1I7VLC5_LOALO